MFFPTLRLLVLTMRPLVLQRLEKDLAFELVLRRSGLEFGNFPVQPFDCVSLVFDLGVVWRVRTLIAGSGRPQVKQFLA